MYEHISAFKGEILSNRFPIQSLVIYTSLVQCNLAPLVGDGDRNQDLNARCVYHYWTVIAPEPFQQRGLRNIYIYLASVRVCVYHTHTVSYQYTSNCI